MPKQSPLNHLVRVTYRLFPDDPESTFVGTVVDERPPGRGPIKPGKRFWVVAKEAIGLTGWFSDREFEVLGYDADRLSPAEYLMLETLCTWSVLGYHQRAFPTRLSRVARGLETKGLVRVKSDEAVGTVLVTVTESGRAVDVEAFHLVPQPRTKTTGRAAL